MKKASEGVIKTYTSYASMLLDFGNLSDNMDVSGSMTRIPNFCFKTKDGQVRIAGTFQHMLRNVKEYLGIQVNPVSSKQYLGAYIVSFTKYAKAEEKSLDKIEISPVDTPAKKRATRTKKAE